MIFAIINEYWSVTIEVLEGKPVKGFKLDTRRQPSLFPRSKMNKLGSHQESLGSSKVDKS